MRWMRCGTPSWITVTSSWPWRRSSVDVFGAQAYHLFGQQPKLQLVANIGGSKLDRQCDAPPTTESN